MSYQEQNLIENNNIININNVINHNEENMDIQNEEEYELEVLIFKLTLYKKFILNYLINKLKNLKYEDIEIIYDKFNTECCICLNKFKKHEDCIYLEKCNHNFHKDCLLKCIESAHFCCPLCRNDYTVDSFIEALHIIENIMI